MKFLPRAIAICITAALVLPTGAWAAGPLSRDARQQDLDALYETLEQKHPNLFAHTPQADFLARKTEIEARLDTISDLEFTFDLQALTALAGDSHTTASLSDAEAMRFYPFSLSWYDGDWVLSVVDQPNAQRLGDTVIALNGYPMDEVLGRFAAFVSADNAIKLRRQTQQLLYAHDILAYLGLAESGGSLVLTLSDAQGTERQITLSPLPYADFQAVELARLSDQRTALPATARDKRKYYFALPLDENTYYIQYNRCQEDPDLPMETFAAQVSSDLSQGAYTQVLLDLRNNGGGSDGVIWPLLDLLAPGVRDGSLRLYGLVGETTFSSAVINAVMIREMGGILAGAPTSGSVDHFGSTRSFTLPNSALKISYSTKWIHMGTLFESALDAGVEPIRPDVVIEPTLADYLAGKDTVVEYLLAHGSQYQAPDASGNLLTRGRLLTQLYEAARSAGKDVAAPTADFRDTLSFAYYAPAVNWAVQTGIAAGNGAGALEPVRPVTRAEAAVMLVRYADFMGLSLTAQEISFSDEDLIPFWALDAARQSGDLGLLDAKSGAFRPNDTMTRADGAALVQTLGF